MSSPSAASHPGELLRFFLIEEGTLLETAAEEAGLPVAVVREIVNGTGSVTPEVAAKLGTLWGTSADMWMKLQARFDAAR